jgi:hypothetical protein
VRLLHHEAAIAIKGERSRRLADDGRHLTDPAVRSAGIFVGIVNAAPMVILSVAQQCVGRL